MDLLLSTSCISREDIGCGETTPQYLHAFELKFPPMESALATGLWNLPLESVPLCVNNQIVIGPKSETVGDPSSCPCANDSLFILSRAASTGEIGTESPPYTP